MNGTVQKKHLIAKTLGLLVAALLTTLLVMMGNFALGDPSKHGGSFHREVGVGLVLVGLPLLLLLAAITLYLFLRKATRGAILRWMWLPAPAAAMVIIALVMWRQHLADAMARDYPEVYETHINLTGKDRWLVHGDESVVLDGQDDLVNYAYRTHNAKNKSDPMIEYVKGALAPGFTSMPVYFAKPPAAQPTRVPVVRVPAPDMALIAPALAEWWEPRLHYVYYHYPDRIEVATAFEIPGDILERPSTAAVPLVEYFLHNLAPHAIARVEVGGQTLGAPPVKTQLAASADICRLTGHMAVTPLGTTLKVRWQAAQAMPAWQEASVALPAFAPLAPAQGTPHSTMLHLYFLADGSVSVERAQRLTLADGKQAVRFTAPAPALPSAPPCGTGQHPAPSEPR